MFHGTEHKTNPPIDQCIVLNAMGEVKPTLGQRETGLPYSVHEPCRVFGFEALRSTNAKARPSSTGIHLCVDQHVIIYGGMLPAQFARLRESNISVI
jgi:hypothetical protein